MLFGEEGPGPSMVGALVSEDNARTWRLYELFGPPPGYRDRPEGFGEAKLAELPDGRIWMVFRTCLGHLWQTFSPDGGRTWGKPSSTELVAPMSPVNARRIPGTNSVVVVWNNAKPTSPDFLFPRAPLVFAVSHDNCKTWSRPVIITNGYGYIINIGFSDSEMFINYESPGPMLLVAYDLKTVLSLKPTTGSQAAG